MAISLSSVASISPVRVGGARTSRRAQVAARSQPPPVRCIFGWGSPEQGSQPPIQGGDAIRGGASPYHMSTRSDQVVVYSWEDGSSGEMRAGAQGHADGPGVASGNQGAQMTVAEKIRRLHQLEIEAEDGHDFMYQSHIASKWARDGGPPGGLN
mmetsp:Transcript_11441/g.36138  ORF Transcript_11441/g.36138 Transcript_11441/m.36138 type:complete len:154 (+) Transcript_11441:167-628(+)|eukprot:CAMPEP_0182854948 /NCGR_PEP_ID=MMETSP0034_2-20130328/1561_1 /TAXON_ID=156128 /ORGANISM="Nephroselmis pyriformis, Strain CCMP717" /LENGTH=153 /DNA_ID=CAMNT_0024985847 /DNA_START=102 /DNA_END=563 /DNA_ORIENTATION=-